MELATGTQERSQAVESAPGARTMCEAFQATVRRYPDQVALRTADDATRLTFADYGERVRRLAAGLAALGVGRGDAVPLMMTNRFEFHLRDAAAIHLGATPFSIYNTSSPEQIAYVFGNAQNRVVMAERQFLDRIRAAQAAGGGEPLELICVDGAAEGALSLAEVEERGDPGFDFEAAWRAVEPDDVLTLIYTSGTTGPPKGVELTHANMLAQCRAVRQVLDILPGDTITSYLPSAHAADRWSSHYNQMLYGIEVTTIPDPRTVTQVLPELHPTVWGTVPRVLEKVKAALDAAIASEPDENRRAAIETGIEKARLERAREPVPEELAGRYAALDEQVLLKLRAKLGLDRARWILVGAAPLARDVHELFLGI